MTYGDIAEVLGRGGARGGGLGDGAVRLGRSVVAGAPGRRLLPAVPRGRGPRALPRRGHAAGARAGRRSAGRPVAWRGWKDACPSRRVTRVDRPDVGQCPAGRRRAAKVGRAPPVSVRGDGIGPVLTLRRAPSRGRSTRPPLDEVQQAALAHRGGVLRVLGGPGTGKTTTAIEVVVGAGRVGGGDARPVPRPDVLARRTPAACASGSRPGSAAPRPSRSPGPTRRSGSASCARRPRCAATRRRGCSAGPSRTSSCASCSPGTPPRTGPARRWPERVHARAGHPRFPRRAA